MPYTMQQRHIRYIITTILLGFVSVTAVSCGDDEAQRESCSTTQSECSPDGTGYRICVSGYWSVAIPCLENQTCKNGQCYDVLQRESCTATQPVCLPDGTGYRVCVQGNWSDVFSCGEGMVCTNGECAFITDKCTATEPECTPDAKGYRVCVQGNWSDVIPCSETTTCKLGRCSGTDKCTATEPECTSDNKGYRVCVQGNWSDVIPCSVATTCKSGRCSGEDATSNLPCKEGDESRCVSESRVQICGDDKFWRFMDCPAEIPVCHDGECGKPNCTPGDKRCISDKQTQKCNENGFWETNSFCGTGTCLNGDCMEKCSPGENYCVTESMAYVCGKSGYWESVECGDDKVCFEGECRTCKDGQKRCEGLMAVATCENGNWRTTTSCYRYCSPDAMDCIKLGDSCIGVVSFCDGSQLIWCSGDKLRISYSLDDPCGCVRATDGVGATCTFRNWGGEEAWNQDSLCNALHATKTGKFGNASHFTANCLQCKKMEDGSKRWVPVDESNCK